MSDGSRVSIYLNPPLAAAQKRAKKRGETFSAELSIAVQRYEALVEMVAPDLSDSEYAQLQRTLATKPRLPLALVRPRLVAAMVEDSVTDASGEAVLRAAYGLARRVARMSPAQVLAAVSVVEDRLREEGIR